MSRASQKTRARTYGRRLHDLVSRPPAFKPGQRVEAEDSDPRDYLGRTVAPETELELRARDGDR